MTTTGPVSDAVLRQALLELAAGPGAGELLSDVMRAAESTPQIRRLGWPVLDSDRRRLGLIGLAALLIVAMLGALIVAGGFLREPPINSGTLSIVVQSWNHLAEPDSFVSHAAFMPASGRATRVETLPKTAINLMWSTDGTRLVYFSTEPTVRTGGLGSGPRLSTNALYAANGDGTDAVQVALPRPVVQYPSNDWSTGALWAPAGQRFALPWSTNSCTGSDCIPPGGVDVFDRDGRLVASIPTPDNVGIKTYWSNDGRAIGWTSGSCPGGDCTDDAFHWRAVDGDATVTTIPGRLTGIVWAPDARLHVVNEDAATRVLTMARDGSDVRGVPWGLDQVVGPVWSPDGRWLAAVDDNNVGTLRLRDVIAGTDLAWSIPRVGFASWSPDSRTIALYGDPAAPNGSYSFFTIAIDTGQLMALGDGDDFAWAPSSVVSAR